MTMKEVIENELKCVQRDCCRLENECAKCDLVLPKEEIINAYNKALKLEKENAELKTRVENQKSFLERIRAKFKLGKLERKEIEGYFTNEQLTAAKDLLKRWVDDRVYTVSEQKDLIADTEQFLEEE